MAAVNLVGHLRKWQTTEVVTITVHLIYKRVIQIQGSESAKGDMIYASVNT